MSNIYYTLYWFYSPKRASVSVRSFTLQKRASVSVRGFNPFSISTTPCIKNCFSMQRLRAPNEVLYICKEKGFKNSLEVVPLSGFAAVKKWLQRLRLRKTDGLYKFTARSHLSLRRYSLHWRDTLNWDDMGKKMRRVKMKMGTLAVWRHSRAVWAAATALDVANDRMCWNQRWWRRGKSGLLAFRLVSSKIIKLKKNWIFIKSKKVNWKKW